MALCTYGGHCPLRPEFAGIEGGRGEMTQTGWANHYGIAADNHPPNRWDGWRLLLVTASEMPTPKLHR